MSGQRRRAGFAAIAIDWLWIWLALIGCGVAGSAARAQGNEVCGNLSLRVTPVADRVLLASSNLFLLQVFRHDGGRESPVLPGTPFTPVVPGARCVGGSVLMVSSFSVATSTPFALLVFQDGSHLSERLGDADYELRGDVIVIPPRPRLLPDARERIPVEYRGLFDYSGRTFHND